MVLVLIVYLGFVCVINMWWLVMRFKQVVGCCWWVCSASVYVCVVCGLVWFVICVQLCKQTIVNPKTQKKHSGVNCVMWQTNVYYHDRYQYMYVNGLGVW